MSRGSRNCGGDRTLIAFLQHYHRRWGAPTSRDGAPASSLPIKGDAFMCSSAARRRTCSQPLPSRKDPTCGSTRSIWAIPSTCFNSASETNVAPWISVAFCRAGVWMGSLRHACPDVPSTGERSATPYRSLHGLPPPPTAGGPNMGQISVGKPDLNGSEAPQPTSPADPEAVSPSAGRDFPCGASVVDFVTGGTRSPWRQAGSHPSS